MPRREKTKPKRAVSDGEANVHRKLHGGADADRRTIDGGDDGLEAFVDGERHTAAAIAHALIAEIDRVGGAGIAFGPIAAFGGIEGVGAGGEIGTGAEGAPLARDHDRAHIVVIVHAREDVDHLLHHRRGKGVELFRDGGA